MQEFVNLNKDFQNNLSILEDYVKFNRDSEQANYRKFRDIVYGAIINRSYTLWETLVKDLFYEYFQLKKEEYFRSNSIIERYKLHELPSYLFETAVFNLKDERISFELNREILSYTSKNMDMKELNKLFRRIDLNIANNLDNNNELKEAVKHFEVAFENGSLKEDNRTSMGLKRIIQERNLVSHYAHLDEFQGIDILLEWINFYKLLGKILSKYLSLEYVETLNKERQVIGECKNVLSQNILLVDTANGININKNTKIFVYSNNKLVDIVIPQSFRTEDKEVTNITENSKAGIKLETIFEFQTKIKKEYEYCLIKDV
ncbi:hypothetical protein [Metabacillus litoralis]|uniref:hypothetical protein n=1 Tax=Metabacillus litoralis TaxID=152268 RepID=UPI00203D3220|nr:hypothetical protein [Metabacillus litoralis]MCM3412367.1 hypothetical protein [Metabacillus litoralis]